MSAAMAPSTAARAARAPRAAQKSMKVWNPIGNKFFETFSFLPPLTRQQVAKQIDYCSRSGFTPCIEFSPVEYGYCSTHGWSGLDSSISACYYDNRYWSMWKLPMYGCTDSMQVLEEIGKCVQTYPTCFVRVCGFDADKQVQTTSFIVHRPPGQEQLPTANRSF